MILGHTKRKRSRTAYWKDAHIIVTLHFSHLPASTEYLLLPGICIRYMKPKCNLTCTDCVSNLSPVLDTFQKGLILS